MTLPGIGGDSLKAQSLVPGIGVSPLQQTQPAGAPYTLGITGHFPGENVDVGLCFYKQSDADKGGYYPCCKVNVTARNATPGLRTVRRKR